MLRVCLLDELYGRTLFSPRHTLLCLYVYYANCSSVIEMGLFKPNWKINYVYV